MYTCESRKYTTTCKSSYTRHLKTVCNKNELTIGDRQFSVLNDRQVHCVVCDKRILRASAKKHSCRGAPKNTCKFCGKTFNHASNINAHNKICKQKDNKSTVKDNNNNNNNNEDNKDNNNDKDNDNNNNNNNNNEDNKDNNKDNNNNNNKDNEDDGGRRTMRRSDNNNNNNKDNEDEDYNEEENEDYNEEEDNDYNYYNERSDREQGYDTEMKEVYRIAAEERDRFCLLNDVDDKRVFCVDGSNITIDMCRALKAQLHDAFKLHGLAYELMSTTKPSLVVAYIKSGFTGYEPSLEFIKKIK